jgi:hypothetical protein
MPAEPSLGRAGAVRISGAQFLTSRGTTTMKALLCALLLSATPAAGRAAIVQDDPVALQLIDHMSDVIGELNSCSYNLRVERDVNDPALGLIKHFSLDEVHMHGPDRMLIKMNSDTGNKGYWYDGAHITYYNFDENNYATVAVTGNIIETIDRIHQNYGVDFPASDFFYPTFTDDLINGTDRIALLGKALVEGRSCYHILATSEKVGIQLWIADDALNLPVKFSIANYDQKNTPQYIATFSNWKLNPSLPSAIFDFVPPASAVRITLVPKQAKP